MPELLYKFTPDELRLVGQVQAKLMQTLQFIIDLHELKGNLTLAPDLSGFVEQQPGAKP